MVKRIASSVLARRLVQALIDACLVALAYLMAFLLRFDPSMPHRYAALLAESIAFVVVGKLLIFWLFGLYHKLWRFIGQQDLETLVRAVVVARLALLRVLFLIPPPGAGGPPPAVT